MITTGTIIIIFIIVLFVSIVTQPTPEDKTKTTITICITCSRCNTSYNIEINKKDFINGRIIHNTPNTPNLTLNHKRLIIYNKCSNCWNIREEREEEYEWRFP